MSEVVSLRERTRRAVRAEIVQSAMGLFLSRGFEATTVDEIAHASGISRRSYFRYFHAKDDALAEGLARIGRTVAAALTQRPESETLWVAMRRAFDPLVEQAQTDPRAEALGRLMLERPTIQQGKDAAWQAEISAAIAARIPTTDADTALRAEAIAAAAIACLHVAQAQWLDPEEHRALDTLLDTAMAAVDGLT